MSKESIAILEKIRQIYDHDDDHTFLTVNPVAIPLSYDDLSFDDKMSADAIRQSQKRAADFSTIVNYIPQKSPVWTHNSNLIWDVYNLILYQTEWAQNTLSKKQEKKLNAAQKRLYTKKQDGTLQPSPSLRDYRKFEKKYYECLEQYNTERITAEYSSDESVKNRWESKKEQLERNKEQARLEWVGRGQKAKIEQAFATIDRLTRQAPELLWDTWREQFDRAKETESDRDFYRTHFIPSEIHQNELEDSWTKITLGSDEIKNLVTQANQNISGVINSGFLDSSLQANLEIERLSVELARVDLVRPWFAPELFTNRTWRWTHDREPLSTGGESPKGSLPAYPVALIFARDLKIELKPNSEQNSSTVKELQNGSLLGFGPLLLEPIPSTLDASTITRLELAQFDSDETSAIRDITRAETPTEVSNQIDVHVDLLEVNPRVLDLATMISSSNLDLPSIDEISLREDLPELEVHPRIRLPERPRPGFHPRNSRDFSSGWWQDIVFNQPEVTVQESGGYEGTVLELYPEGEADQPISSVDITFEKEDGSITKTIRSDENGFYRIELEPGQYTIKARHFGYKNKTYSVEYAGGGFQQHYIMLEKEVQQLPVEPRKSIQIIGWICTKVGKAPNPDPKLKWE